MIKKFLEGLYGDSHGSYGFSSLGWTFAFIATFIISPFIYMVMADLYSWFSIPAFILLFILGFFLSATIKYENKDHRLCGLAFGTILLPGFIPYTLIASIFHFIIKPPFMLLYSFHESFADKMNGKVKEQQLRIKQERQRVVEAEREEVPLSYRECAPSCKECKQSLS